MASAAYEGGGGGGGGIGGKFRKRRPSAASPYDRPPTAVRGPRPGGLAAAAGEGGNNRWLSRIVDPASRIFASGASRLFSSVFRKRLPAPPLRPPAAETVSPPPAENLLSSHQVPEVAAINSLSDAQERGGINEDNLINNSGPDGISELELLLKQKTFTRGEFDHLTELLRSRTVDAGTSEPAGENNSKDTPMGLEREKAAGSSRLLGSTTTPLRTLHMPEEDVASPAEIAKAYMGSRPSKLSPAASNVQSQVFREDTTLQHSVPYAVKPSDVSDPPRSVVRFGGVVENGYLTPRPRGRSAIYKMSRSPYFNVQSRTNGRAIVPSKEPSASSQWTPSIALHAGGKQALKRGSSVLDGDFGSFGPIRRIRQKSNLVSPLKDKFSGNLLTSPSASFGKAMVEGATSSVQKPMYSYVQKHGILGQQDAENIDKRLPDSSCTPISSQSIEMERKISKAFEKLVPSPKEKPLELKAISRNDSPSKLTLDMLDGRALRSMEVIDPSNFHNMQSGHTAEICSQSNLPTLAQMQDKVEENGPPRSNVSGFKLTSVADSTVNAIAFPTYSKTSLATVDTLVSGIPKVPLQERPSFQMTAPEISLELEDDYNIGVVSGPSVTGKDELKPVVLEHKSVASETSTLEESLVPSSADLLATSTLPSMSDTKASGKPVGFSFHVPPSPSPQQHEQIPAPEFSFVSREAQASTSTTTCDRDLRLKFGARSDSELKFSASNVVITTKSEDPSSDNVGKSQKAGEFIQLHEDAAFSGLSASATTARFPFGASVTPSLSNGSLSSTLSTFSAPAIAPSDGPVSSISAASTVSSSSPINISCSTAAPIFSTVPSFGISADSSPSVFTPSDKSVPNHVEAVTVNEPQFSTTNTTFGSSAFSTKGSSSSSSALTAPSIFSSTDSSSSSMPTLSTFSKNDGGSHKATPSLFSSTISSASSMSAPFSFQSMGSSSTVPATSSLFSSMASSSSATSSLSPFSSTSCGMFGLSSPAQASSSSLSFLNNQVQSSASSFGAVSGSNFGTKTISSDSSISHLPQSTSQPSSLSSSPSFGLSGSSSVGFGGSATSSVKPFGSSSVFSFSAGAGSSSSFSSPTTSLFSSSSHTSTPHAFGSNFGSSASPGFGSSFGSTMSSSSTGFVFGQPSTASGSSSLASGSSPKPVFPFTSVGSSALSTSTSAQPAFGTSAPVFGFGLGSPANDQMNVEDSMTDDSVQVAAPTIPSFGQPSVSPGTPSFMFSSPAIQTTGFQFGNQNSSVPQNSPFQPGGNLEFPPGGSFSLGSGGGDKSGRKIVKIRRDNKHRKK